VKRATLTRMDEHFAYTVRDYVELEDGTDLKHEFYQGDIRAMGGGSNRHAMISASLVGQLYPQLRTRNCEVFSCDLRIRIGDVITYPDASVVCGEVQMDLEDPNAQLNPTVVLEVTSPSSEKYDRGGKFKHYQRIPSLREYVIVSQREPLIEVFRRADDGSWLESVRAEAGQRAKLLSIQCELDVDELYGR
jgi:Uma2 family endonuclease